MSKEQVKAFKAPSPIIILVCVILFCALASYVIPAGVYERVKDVHTGKMVVDPATFHYVAQKPTGFMDFFTSINKGFKGGHHHYRLSVYGWRFVKHSGQDRRYCCRPQCFSKKNAQSQHSADSGVDDYAGNLFYLSRLQ